MKDLRLTELRVSNFMAIKALRITPDGNIIKLEGPRGAGKTSVIKALFSALRGAGERPDKPIREGETKAEVFADLGDITVSLKIEKNMADYLVIKSKDGLKGNQSTLNMLLSKLIDPEEFIRMRPKERRDLLLELIGKRTKIESLEHKHSTVFENRTLINHEIRNLEGKLDGAPDDQDIEEKSVSELLQQLKKAEGDDQEIEKMRDDIVRLEDQRIEEERLITGIEDQIKNLIEEKGQRELQTKDFENKALHLSGMIEKSPPSQVPAIQAELETVEDHNESVRAIYAANNLRAQVKDKKIEVKVLNIKLKEIDEAKYAILKDSDLPIKEIDFDGDTLLVGGIPFDQLSGQDQIDASVRIGLCRKPKLRLLCINQGGEYTTSGMKQLDEIAKELDCQIIVVRPTDEPQGGIFIKEGEIVTESEPVEEPDPV